MKKILFIAASAMLVIASCTNDESAPEQIEVGFNAFTKKTKSIVTGTTFTQTENVFKVWGFADQDATASIGLESPTIPNFMYDSYIINEHGYVDGNLTGVVISNVGTSSEAKWKQNGRSYYWPFTGIVGFYGLHPSTISPTSLTWGGGLKIDNYTIETNYPDEGVTNKNNSSNAGAVDIMYAYGEGGKAINDIEAVDMQFKHALSQVLFKFKTDKDYSADVTITVNAVTLNHLDLTGNFKFLKYPTLPEVEAEWTNNETQESTFKYCNTDFEAIYVDPLIVPQPDINYGKSTLMIPQSILGIQNATVTFVVAQTGSNPFTYNLNIPLTCENNKWAMGKKYVYTVNFKMDEILFNPTIVDWVDVNVAQIDLFDDSL